MTAIIISFPYAPPLNKAYFSGNIANNISIDTNSLEPVFILGVVGVFVLCWPVTGA